MYIYADILLITNIYVDFLLIKSAALLTHSHLRTGRGIFAAFIGSIFSLAIFLPKAFSYILIPLKLISSVLIVLRRSDLKAAADFSDALQYFTFAHSFTAVSERDLLFFSADGSSLPETVSYTPIFQCPHW